MKKEIDEKAEGKKEELKKYFPKKFPKGKFGKPFGIMGQREKYLDDVI